LAEMVGWLRKGVGELHAQVIHTIPAKFSHGRSLRQVRADPPGRIVFQYGNLARLYKALKPPYAWPAIPRAIRYKTLTSAASAFPSGGSNCMQSRTSVPKPSGPLRRRTGRSQRTRSAAP
jgi:hypothetical protein